jgi:serine/threonine protein kinase
MPYFKPIIDIKLSSAKRSSGGESGQAKHDPRVPLAKDTVLNAYRFKKLVGSGSFSLVYSAIEISSGREVVIKEYFPKHFSLRQPDNTVIPFDGGKLLAFREAFKQFHYEALTMEKARHPNVLNSCNFFRANKTAYLVSINHDGRDLKWFLNSFQDCLDQNLIYRVFMPVLSALNFLHDAKLLHLDIKPANILLRPNGESMLLDFGASQSMNSSKRIHQSQVLTHGFAPPEQYNKSRALGPWTDIYAVAASFYYCISGKSPLKSKGSGEASRLDVSQYSKNYCPMLLHTINRSLSLDATRRFASIDDFAAALLVETKWKSLQEYELDVMDYDRFAVTTLNSQSELVSLAA